MMREKLYFRCAQNTRSLEKVKETCSARQRSITNSQCLQGKSHDNFGWPGTARDVVNVGKTNHCGITKTLSHLKRRYYCRAMQRIIKDVIARCDAYRGEKYDWNPVKLGLMQTETHHDVNQVSECGMFILPGRWITKRLEPLFQVPGQPFSSMHSPEKMVLDNERQFNKAELWTYLASLQVLRYYIIPQHLLTGDKK